MSKSIDDLVASIPESRSGSGCWAANLTGRSAEFVAALKAKEQSGVKLHRQTILTLLKKEFGITIGQEAVRNHLAGTCRCA